MHAFQTRDTPLLLFELTVTGGMQRREPSRLAHAAGPLLARPPLEARGRRCTSPNQQRPPPSSFAHTACSCRFRYGRAQDTMTHGPTWHTPLVTRTCIRVCTGQLVQERSQGNMQHASCMLMLWLPTVNCCVIRSGRAEEGARLRHPDEETFRLVAYITGKKMHIESESERELI